MGYLDVGCMNRRGRAGWRMEGEMRERKKKVDSLLRRGEMIEVIHVNETKQKKGQRWRTRRFF